MTDQIAARIRASAGEGIDTAQLVVYEAIALNTLPLNKKGSIFHGATVDLGVLQEMASVPATAGVPLHTLHQQGMELPAGRVFYAQVVQSDSGVPELRAQFYVPLTEAGLISKLDTAVIDETSVGLRSKQILCSKCNFDYAAPGNLMCLLDQTCPDGHQVGTDGTRVVLKGLDRWMEFSLVSRGAANGPKIVGRTKALLGDHYQELVAAGGSPEATVLFGTVTKENPMSTPDFVKLTTDLVAASSEAAVAKAALTAMTGERDTLTTQLTAARAEIVTLKGAADADKTKLTADLAAANAEIDEVKAFLTAQLKASWAASGHKFEDKDVPADVKGLRVALDAATVSVHKLIPVGGRANVGDGDTETADNRAARLAAFKL